MKNEVFNSYREHVKERFGGRIQKVTLDAKFTCPNRDGTKSTGGCTYCNNESFATAMKVRENTITEQVESGIAFCKSRYRNSVGYFAYFQANSNTYAPLDTLKGLYSEALAFDEIIGLVVGTRPDCVDLEKIEYFEEIAKEKEVIIEYGIESIYDETLERINRCHDYQCFLDAVEMTKGRGIKMCVHLIIGFPWETKEQWINTAREISKLPIDYIKLHQLHIVKNTIMGNQYKAKPFPLPTKPEYMDILTEFLEELRPSIVVQRMFGTASKNITLSEHWPETVSELNDELISKMKAANTYQGRLYQ